MHPLLILAIVLLSPLLLFLAIFIVNRVTRIRYLNFLLSHSEAYRQLLEIKGEYRFEAIPSFNMANRYDNVDYYGTISPEDYLIYNLVDTKDRVSKAISDARGNKAKYEKMQDEIRERCHLGTYDVQRRFLFKDNLSRMEKDLIKRNYPKPTTSVSIFVRLCLTHLDGTAYASKSDNFGEDEILSLIKRIKRKRGDYYLDEDIYRAICRVERGKVTNRLRFEIFERDHYRCLICGSEKNLEIDHIIPISKGGKSTYDNLQTLCHDCNKRKDNDIV